MSNKYQKPAEVINHPSKGEEVKEMREETSKTFSLGKDKYKKIISISNLHYKDDYSNDEEEWKEIDLTVQPNGDLLEVKSAPYTIKISDGVIGYEYESNQGGTVKTNLQKISGRDFNKNITPEIDGNILWWRNVADGVDMKLVLRPKSAEIYKIIKTQDAPSRFTWAVEKEIGKSVKYQEKVLGKDAIGDNLEINTNKKVLEKTSKKERFEVTEEWTGRVSRVVDKETRIKNWQQDAQYPVIIDANTSEEITAGIDDVHYLRNSNGAYTNFVTDDDTIWFGRFYTHYPGFRFRSLGIPQGATIDSATIKAQIASNFSSIDVIQRFYADDVDDAAQWSSNDTPADIAKTNIYKDWTLTSGVSDEQTVSTGFTSLVQEVINRAGWSSGNNIRFGGFPQQTDQIGVYAYEGYPFGGFPCTLEVTYTASSGETGEISEIDGVGIDDISQIDGVGKDDISEIHGLDI